MRSGEIRELGTGRAIGCRDAAGYSNEYAKEELVARRLLKSIAHLEAALETAIGGGGEGKDVQRRGHRRRGDAAVQPPSPKEKKKRPGKSA